ncbi:MAG: hypothetical protein AAF800_03185 [Planctomycetota bacterium]
MRRRKFGRSAGWGAVLSVSAVVGGCGESDAPTAAGDAIGSRVAERVAAMVEAGVSEQEIERVVSEMLAEAEAVPSSPPAAASPEPPPHETSGVAEAARADSWSETPMVERAAPSPAPAASAPAANAPAEVSRPPSTAVDPDAPFPTFDRGSSLAPAAAERQTTPAAASAGTPTVFKKHAVTDPGMHNQPAFTMLVPEDWAIEGGMIRPGNQYFANTVFMNLKLAAPDGRAVQFLPTMSFEFSARQPAPNFSPTRSGNFYYPLPESPGTWLMEVANAQPDPDVTHLRLVSEEPEPTMTKQLRQQSAAMYQIAQQQNQTGAQLGMQTAFDTQATVVKLRYAEKGVELEEQVLVGWQYYIRSVNGQLDGGNWAITTMISLRGPVGSDYMNDPEMATVFRTLRPDPKWQAEMNRHYAEMARIQRRGQEQRQRDWQRHNAKMQQIRQETSDIIATGHANREAIRDAGHQRQVDAVREVTPFDVGDGTQVEIPNHYENVYTDGAGRFVLTNDLNYNPNRDLNLSGSWDPIQPAR